MHKAISSVIVAILMLIITIGIAASAWMYISGMLGAKISTSFSVMDAFDNVVIILNDGNHPITELTGTIFSPEEDAALQVTPMDESLIAYWHLDEGSGNVAEDEANENDGTLYNNPQWVDGKFGKALSFDGVNDYVEIPVSPSMNVGSELTILAWVKIPSTWTWKWWRDFVSRSADWRFETFVEENRLSIWIRDVNDARYALPSSPISRDEFNFFAATYKAGDKLRLFLNGVLDGERSAGGDISWTPTQNLYIGAASPAAGFVSAVIDEVRIYNRALTEAEIEAHYRSNVGVAIMPGQKAKIKVLNPLSRGTHTLRLCTPSVCRTISLHIY